MLEVSSHSSGGLGALVKSRDTMISSGSINYGKEPKGLMLDLGSLHETILVSNTTFPYGGGDA